MGTRSFETSETKKPSDTASHPRRLEFSKQIQREYQISIKDRVFIGTDLKHQIFTKTSLKIACIAPCIL